MRAVRVDRLGTLEDLRLAEIPPPAPRPGQIGVSVHAAGVNFADTLMVSGHYQETPEPPFTLGMELAGVVSAVGEGVDRFEPGDRVFAVTGHGAFADEAVVEAVSAYPIPRGLGMAAAAAYPVAYGTAHVGLAHRAGLKQGEVLVVTGAGGGVGLTAVEVGKALGATVVAAAGSDEKLAAARERGADHLINYRSEPMRDRIRELTGGADVVFDPVGGDAFGDCLRAARPEARVLVVGFASGTIPKIPANVLLVKNVDVIGFYWGAYARLDPLVHRKSFEDLTDLYKHKRIAPAAGEVVPLERAGEALAMLAERRATGKIVLSMRDEV